MYTAVRQLSELYWTSCKISAFIDERESFVIVNHIDLLRRQLTENAVRPPRNA